MIDSAIGPEWGIALKMSRRRSEIPDHFLTVS
jgi:hypothetical protein